MSRVVKIVSSGKIIDVDCNKWENNPLRNPATNRTILHYGPTFRKIKHVCDLESSGRSPSPRRSKSHSPRRSKSPRNKSPRKKSPINNLTKRELQHLAAGIIPGFSIMSKPQLINALISMPPLDDPLPYVTAKPDDQFFSARSMPSQDDIFFSARSNLYL